MLPSCCKREVGLDHTEKTRPLSWAEQRWRGKQCFATVFSKYLVCLLLALYLPQDVCQGLGSG